MSRTDSTSRGQAGADVPAYGVPPPGYRLPAGTTLGTVRLQVADLTRSLAYYEGVLGLRVLDRAGGVARLGASEGSTPLVELRERPGAAAVARRGPPGRFRGAAGWACITSPSCFPTVPRSDASSGISPRLESGPACPTTS